MRELPTELIELEAGLPAHGGAVIAKAEDGRTVFLRGALPGEKVRAQVTADHKKFLWADTVEVLEPSEQRVAHVWSDPKDVGAAAADLGFISREAQLQWKATVLADQLRRIGGEELAEAVRALYPDGVQVQSLEEDLDEGVRTRVQLVAGSDGRLGMRPYRSDRVVPVEEVPLAVPAISNVADLDPGDEKWSGKWAAGDRVSLVAPTGGAPRVVTPKGSFDRDTGEENASALQWTVAVGDKEHIFKVRPDGFWQTHRLAPQALTEAVLEAADVEPGERVLELYSGAGLFSRFLADAVGPAGQLLTLELDEGAVEDAGVNLLDAVEDDFVELYQGKVDATSVQELAQAADAPVSTVVLDPPRKGAGKDVMEAIADTPTQRVVLVSCDPAAAARDIRDLTSCGFSLESLRAWDLFPNTHHFETVAALQRNASATGEESEPQTA